MAENLQTIHISELEEQNTLNDNDVLPLDTPDNRTLKVKAETIKEYATEELSLSKIDRTEKGAANGVATLDSTGMVPVSQLPSFVDDVLEGTAQNVVETAASTFSADGFILKGQSTLADLEEGKTYVDITSNIQYRWTGTGNNLVSMGVGLALGETSNTAYAGNKGKANADAIADLQSGKVDKIAGKGLSSEDYTTEEKQKLAEISVSSDYAEDSEAYAKGTRGGVPVPNTDDAYHNNSLFYSVISGSAMRIAGVSAETAVDNARKSQSYATGDAVDDQGNPYRPGQANDNAKKYCELAEEAARQAGAVDMEGATATTDGAHGLVPKPHAGDQNKYLKGDGTWEEPEGATNLIANIETSSISSHAYAIGQQFVLNGVLHIATAAIAINDAFVVGTNCAINQNITDQIKAIVDAYVTGVKGNSENTYRTGNVNITPANIGAVAESTNPIREYYGTCTTAAATAAKVVTVSDTTFKMVAGTRVTIKFTNTNTAQNPTINVNSKGAKSVLYNTAVVTTGNLSTAGYASRYISYIYDGTYWVWNGWSIDNNTTYSDFTAATADAAGTHGLVPAPAAGKQNSVLLGNKTWGKVPISGGGTNATTAQDARANLGLGSAAGNFRVANPTNSSKQPLHFRWVCQDTSSAYYNKELYLVISDTSIFLYNNTDKATIWTHSSPIAINQGGTNATDRLNAIKNLFNSNAAASMTHLFGIKSDWSVGGYASLKEVRNLMGLGNTTGVLPIANGGTGASSSYGGYIKCVATSSAQTTIEANSGTSVQVAISGGSGWKFVGIVGYLIYNGTGGTGASSIFAYAIAPDSSTPLGTASSVNINCNLRSVNTVQSKVYIQVSTLWIKA